MLNKQIALNPVLVNNPPPSYLNKEDYQIFNKYISYETYPLEYITLTDVYATNELMFFRNFQILKESKHCLNDINFYKKPFNYLRITLINNYKRKKVTIKEVCIWVADRFSNNYFHWLTELMPRIYYGMKVTNCTNVILPSYLEKYDFVKVGLRLLKIKNTYFFNEYEYVKLKKVHIIKHLSEPLFVNPLALQPIKSIFYNHFIKHSETELSFRNVYISRKKALRRKILNEVELVKLLEEYDFEIHTTEDMTLQEQIILFSQCKVICGLHGAGLTNMLFMQENGSVLEIKNNSDPNACYYSMANNLNLKYNYFIAESNANDMYLADFTIDIEKFRLLLDSIKF